MSSPHLRIPTALTGMSLNPSTLTVCAVDSKENPNDVAAEFIANHPDWELIVDDDGDVLIIASPFYEFRRDENASGE